MLTLPGTLLNVCGLKADNNRLSNISLVDDYMLLPFDLGLVNFWRADDINGNSSTNQDSAWIFVKYHLVTENWRYAWLNICVHPVTGTAFHDGLRVRDSSYHIHHNPKQGTRICCPAFGTTDFTFTGSLFRLNCGYDRMNYLLN
ncbi:MAG: hypothetical protein IH598_06285 [Bacteroidales bacterium]|nr:hypothetical protein [Bacteroidales bacterium]